jgi:hypothetical protein
MNHMTDDRCYEGKKSKTSAEDIGWAELDRAMAKELKTAPPTSATGSRLSRIPEHLIRQNQIVIN